MILGYGVRYVKICKRFGGQTAVHSVPDDAIKKADGTYETEWYVYEPISDTVPRDKEVRLNL